MPAVRAVLIQMWLLSANKTKLFIFYLMIKGARSNDFVYTEMNDLRNKTNRIEERERESEFVHCVCI